MRAPTKSYTSEFRADAVALYRRSEHSVKQVAADLGVNHWTLTHWIEQDSMKRKKPKPPAAEPRPASESAEQKAARLERENAKLQRRLADLEEQREILKKAVALFARERE